MGSIVLELQAEVLNSECDILAALRKAHVIASKLDLKAFDEWIMHELNGYFDAEDTEIPEYRKVTGSLIAQDQFGNWKPVIIANKKQEKIINTKYLWQPVSDILGWSRDKQTKISLKFTNKGLEYLNKMVSDKGWHDFELEINVHQFESIIEQVKNHLLDWLLYLEKMEILGENMHFDQNEKDLAKNIPQITNYYFGTVVNGDVKQAQLVSGNQNTMTFNYNNAANMIQAVKAALDEELPLGEDRETADELLAEVEMKLSNQEKPGIIKAAIVGLQSFLISTGANVAGDLVTQFLQQMQ